MLTGIEFYTTALDYWGQMKAIHFYTHMFPVINYVWKIPYGWYFFVGTEFRGINFTVSESGVHVLVSWMAKSECLEMSVERDGNLGLALRSCMGRNHMLAQLN